MHRKLTYLKLFFHMDSCKISSDTLNFFNLMNKYGEKRVSFVFIIDFELKSPYKMLRPHKNFPEPIKQ